MSLFCTINVYSTIMYTTSMTCEYESNEEYQVVLLKAFQVSHYDELGNKMTTVYESIHHSTLSLVLDKIREVYTWANPEHAFFLLFSYDYFKYTHPYIVDLMENHDCTQSYESLIKSI